MKKAIITVVGKDTVGIIAKVCVFLAENNVNILDISQTIVDGYFNMMMVVDVSNAEFDKLATGLKETGEGIGVIIRCQREDIFDKMHRI
ncbi:MAG: ACT domain-containing protein [Lachnospiraceae bacterium]|nr:ACT domain-containing protein [Lachnospiraceae bacterium]MBR5583105.1 ACT domain-containing protein [Lachnospiraceae bacterium]